MDSCIPQHVTSARYAFSHITPPKHGALGNLHLAANRLLGARASARVQELGLTPQQAMLAIDSSGERHSAPSQIAKFMAADSPTVK